MASKGPEITTPVRVSVNLPPKTAETLRGLAEAEGVTITEAIRRAIATQDFFTREARESQRVILEDKQTGAKREVVFPE